MYSNSSFMAHSFCPDSRRTAMFNEKSSDHLTTGSRTTKEALGCANGKAFC
jgi:hypothetical protein